MARPTGPQTNVKARLVLMNFLQFFIWGCWLITIGAYWFQDRHWSGTGFGAIFSTMGLASVCMPTIAGMVADRFMNAERLYGILHISAGLVLCCLPRITSPETFFWAMLLDMSFYMPTIALSITVAYSALKGQGADVVRSYPPIRIWGTIGFIAALWTISLSHNETSPNQFYMAAAVSVVLGVYSFTLPSCPPMAKRSNTRSLARAFGLDAFGLFRTRSFTVFFIFSMLLGAALQLTNAYGDTYLQDFKKVEAYKDLLPVRYPAIIMSISQVSETLFILLIPVFLKKFGIKMVMLFSMIAWVLRFTFFAFADPAEGLWMIILSCIVYGMAFDFFNISGSLFIEARTRPKIRGSAQGLFMMMVNGFGAILGNLSSGLVIQNFFTLEDGSKNWQGIWISFAGYALVLAVVFFFVFEDSRQA